MKYLRFAQISPHTLRYRAGRAGPCPTYGRRVEVIGRKGIWMKENGEE